MNEWPTWMQGEDTEDNDVVRGMANDRLIYRRRRQSGELPLRVDLPHHALISRLREGQPTAEENPAVDLYKFQR
jgi:hypothetical protein